MTLSGLEIATFCLIEIGASLAPYPPRLRIYIYIYIDTKRLSITDHYVSAWKVAKKKLKSKTVQVEIRQIKERSAEKVWLDCFPSLRIDQPGYRSGPWEFTQPVQLYLSLVPVLTVGA